MRQNENSFRARRAYAAAFALLCALGLAAACRPRGDSNSAAGGANNNGSRKQFTEAEVAEIRTLLNGVDQSRYRVTLPAFREGREVGSQTLGNLSVAEVTRIASVRGIKFDEKTPVLGFKMDDDEKGSEAGITPSSASSAGDGSSSNPDPGGGEAGITPSSATGQLRDRIQRLERLLANIDRSQYVLIR